MQRVAEAVSHGAITVVNAMATGRGAALGVGLWTKARVTLTDQAASIKATNLTDSEEDTTLVEETVRSVLKKYGVQRRYGAIVETSSCIPVAVGLKSSSAASNAVALATLRALGKDGSDLDTVRLGVDASLKAGVTLTGAYDDACACYFGGLVITDNIRCRIMRRFAPKGDLRVLIHVPKAKRYTKDVDPKDLKDIKPLIQIIHRKALSGDYWPSLTLNGLIYSLAFGLDSSQGERALEAGAIAAGLSGKGPAVAAVVPKSKVESVLAAWSSLSGKIIETSINYQKAKCLRAAS